jgi:hypothetical protein
MPITSYPVNGAGGGGTIMGTAAISAGVLFQNGTLDTVTTDAAFIFTSATGLLNVPNIQFANKAEVTANAANRGTITYVAGGAGVADTLRVCVKDETDTYMWVPLF